MGTKKLWQFPYGVGGGFKYFSICENFTQKFGGRFYFLGRISRLLTIEKQKKQNLLETTNCPARTTLRLYQLGQASCHRMSFRILCFFLINLEHVGIFFSEKRGANQWGKPFVSHEILFFLKRLKGLVNLEFALK